MIFALWRMDPRSLQRGAASPRASGARSAPACATSARTPELAVPLALMALVGTLRLQLPGGAAAAGPVQLRRRRRRPTRCWSRRWRRLDRRRPRRPAPTAAPTPRLIAGAALAFGVLAAARGGDAERSPSRCRCWRCSAPPPSPSRRRSTRSLQLAVEPEMRGRVMALYSVVFLGSTPIGGPLAGWLSEAYDPRVALLLAGGRRPRRRLGGPRLLRPDARRGPRGPRPLEPARAPASRCSRLLRGTRPRPASAFLFRVRPGRRAPASPSSVRPSWTWRIVFS